MLLSEIKSKLNIAKFELNVAKTTDDQPTDWLRHWDNTARVAVSIHKDLFAELKADTQNSISSLGLQTETREGEQGPYESYRIIKYTPAEFEL